MGIFVTGGRRGHLRALVPGGDRTQRGSMGLPPGFEAVGEALLDEACPLTACETAGSRLGLDGASVQEALSGLRATWLAVRGHDPAFEAVQALVTGWSEAALSVVNQFGCEDPLTGLATTAHLRSALTTLLHDHSHGRDHPQESHALVVVDLPVDQQGPDAGGDPFGRALRLARLGDGARTVFPSGEVVARLTSHRLAVLTVRDERLGTRVRLLRDLVEGMALSSRTPRVWIEGVPATDLSCGFLLDELARS